MVRKLMKHELFALFRVLGFLMIAVVVFAIAGRVLLAVNAANAEMEYYGVSGLLLILVFMFYAFAIIALVFAAYALGISRFYKTLFSGEGYMTLSLPATPMQLIWSKLLSSLIAIFAAALVSAGSLFIIGLGWNSGVLEGLVDVFGRLYEGLAEAFAADPLYAVEEGILMVFSLPMYLLIVYSVLSVGNLFTSKRKVWIAVIVIGGYFLVGMFSALVLQPLYEVAAEVSVHLQILIGILLAAGIDAGCFFLVRYILTHKVNLVV